MQPLFRRISPESVRRCFCVASCRGWVILSFWFGGDVYSFAS